MCPRELRLELIDPCRRVCSPSRVLQLPLECSNTLLDSLRLPLHLLLSCSRLAKRLMRYK